MSNDNPTGSTLIVAVNSHAEKAVKTMAGYAALPAMLRFDILFALKMAYLEGHIDAIQEMVDNRKGS